MLALNSYSHNSNAITGNIFTDKYQRSKSCNNGHYNKGTETEKSISIEDEIDNPHEGKSSLDEVLFETMKHETNRLNSFIDKWPVSYVKIADLAENGFFYLQSEDKVQCAFCRVIVDDWNVGDKPLKKHITKSLRCPFLLSFNVGNVPIVQHPKVSKVSTVGSGSVSSSTYKPKHPRMADLQRRLVTYRDWPIISLSTQQLAECGLYYTGQEDYVDCFFCGGRIGNWELNDDPWEEHTRLYPRCGYVNLVKRHGGMRRQLSAPAPQAQVLSCPTTHQSGQNQPTSLHSEIISEACRIFSKPLVEKVVIQHLKETSRHFTTLNELCEAVLEYSERESFQSLSHDVTGHSNVNQNKCESIPDVEVCSGPGDFTGTSSDMDIEESHTNNTKTDLLLCKICMDRQSNMAFQPCGHMVTCQKCALLIYTCPVCRASVESKIKIYIG